MRRLALAALLLATGCGLPLTDGARPAGDVQDERSRLPGIKILPPGPQPGASAQDVVLGFLRAQGSPDDDHRVARQFLAPGTRWDDDSFVVVYESGSQAVRVDPSGRPDSFLVGLTPVARIGDDGSYRLADPTRPPTIPFRVERVEGGELRITSVPAGLLVNTSDLPRSYAPREVFFAGRTPAPDAAPRLVADRVFLPVTVEPAVALVEALVGGASAPLADAVAPAVPPGTAARVRVDDSGLVTVDLSAEVEQLSSGARELLSAQLVWTLQDYRAVRLLVEGRPFEVPAVEPVQTLDDWTAYDPAGVPADAPLYYVADRRLRSLDDELGSSGDAVSGAVPVDEAAVDPVSGRLAVLTRSAEGLDTVRVGPLQGALGAPALGRADLASLSWGSGTRGLWVLERGPAPIVWLLPSGGGGPVQVDVPTSAAAGLLSRIEVSRDGARLALVYGQAAARRLHVGRIVPTADGVAVDAVEPVAPTLTDVTDVVWESGTSLVVLAASSPSAGLLVLQVAVDGSSLAPVQRQGLQGVPRAVAAAPGRRLVVASAVEGEPQRLFRDDGSSLFQPQAAGGAPFYPG